MVSIRVPVVFVRPYYFGRTARARQAHGLLCGIYLRLLPGASRYDLYDQPEPTGKTLEQLAKFFALYLRLSIKTFSAAAEFRDTAPSAHGRL